MPKNRADSAQADEFAAQYDKTVTANGWCSPEVLFGLLENDLHPGEHLLDLGIGTGLSAVPFTKAGIQVFGVDASWKMLEQCKLKNVTAGLIQHDIRVTPLPYADNGFDHVIACGVFHLLAHLEDIFFETARILRKPGFFAFTIEVLNEENPDTNELDNGGVLELRNGTSGVLSYQHSQDLVDRLLNDHDFQIIRTLDFVAYGKTDWADERSFRAYVARNQKSV